MTDHPDKESKTEQPTQKKLRDAIEKGNIPASRDVVIFSSLIGILFASLFILGAATHNVVTFLARFLDRPGQLRLNGWPDVEVIFNSVLSHSLILLGPIAIVFVFFGLSASFLQSAPRFVVKRVIPDISRLSVKKGLQRIYGKRGVMEFTKACFKFGLMFILGIVMVQSTKSDLVNAIYLDPSSQISLVHNMNNFLIGAIASVYLLLVVADVAWSRFVWRDDLRMTKQEVKDEQKQTEGDPLQKGRLRSMILELSRKRMIAAVPRATMVVANPTHFAVAMRYVKEDMAAPVIVAKGKDFVALKIREIAEKNGVPVLEDKALARSLFDAVEVDRPIPAEFYAAVAELVLYLMNRDDQKSTVAGAGPRARAHRTF